MERGPNGAHGPEAQAHVEAKRAEVTRWEDGAPHLRAPPGDALADTASLPHYGLAPQTSAQVDSQLQRQRWRQSSRWPSATVAGTSQGYNEGPQATTRPRRAGGLLVARGATGLGAIVPIAPVGQWVQSLPPAHDLLGSSGSAHALSPTQSQDTQAAWKPCAPRGSGTCSPCGSPPRPGGVARMGFAPGRRSFSGPPLPWKGATALCPKCTITSGDCRSGDTRCGPSSITSIVALRMARRPRRAFSGRHSRISLKRCYRISRLYLNHGGENTRCKYSVNPYMSLYIQ